MTTFHCDACNSSGISEDLMDIIMFPDVTAWQFVHFNNDAGRVPTLVCKTCYAGFDKAMFGNKIKKRAGREKVARLMALANHMFVGMQERRAGHNEALGRFIEDYVRKGV
jgi:hypothetical protein